jgi:hypothetical protein
MDTLVQNDLEVILTAAAAATVTNAIQKIIALKIVL